MAAGRTNAEIAGELCISLSTTKTHLASLMSKLGARNRAELAMGVYETNRVKGRRPVDEAFSALRTVEPVRERFETTSDPAKAA